MRGFVLLLCAALWLGGPAGARASAALPARPNIVVIIVDDAGLTDFGITGGEAATPAIDALARNGVIFSHFNTAPMCAPSRAMLMTGVDSHDAGVANLPETTPRDQRGARGYEGELTRRAATLAEHLKPAGYQTFITGKWHLGHGPDSLPAARGFDRSFILDASGADNWRPRPYLPFYDRAEWWSDGAPAEPPAHFYSSEFLVDRMLEYLGARDANRPFLAVIGFQAVHIPVQAPREIVERYDGVYDAGWDALLARRHANAVAAGLIPADAAPPVFPPGLRDWTALSDEDRAFATAAMEVEAAMLDAMDRNIARLVDALRAEGAYDDTLFVVVSDNGPEHNQPDHHGGFTLWRKLAGYSTDPETLGGPGTYAWIGAEWAKAAAGHGAYFKMHAGSGGMNTALIVAGPGVTRRGIVDDFAFATDLAPTLLDMVGAAPVAAETPIAGRSLAGALADPPSSAFTPSAPVGMEAGGQSALFLGRLKLARNAKPYGDGQWRLYDWVADPGETRDLAAERPGDFARLGAAYDAFVADHGVRPVDPDYTPGRLMARATQAKQVKRLAPAVLGIAAVLILLGFGVRRALRRGG